ncbi:acetyltransferase (GNAT) domain protein [Leptospira inadai serovar Lyme str. 10]|uniref:Acetyltransferase (GNAT) domain protein n=2 Tax=Leptospira inadai serovar Lyme TaxID=293084 RepID=V6HB20_9LEPT|nr:peptidoglycan bridge formation glycyltransferase FemA/FemB family protein [Leptospira inadai]EQA36736.1 acetyltransferase (GNAT) domain protein [Leptospira inadai serovar Lyme str. 10]PNV75827.1 glycosyltransferase [Leptospira inadai serovar Lyme]
MKFTLAPLPDWRDLAKAVITARRSDVDLGSSWARSNDRSIWFSRSAWSLASIALWAKHIRKKDDIVVWLPDFFCNSSLQQLRLTGARLVFYPITEIREPDYRACRELVKEYDLDIFVIVHYFGKPHDVVLASEFCTTRNALLVEDAAHVLRPIKGVGERGDFILYSPHKHLAIPDGGLLLIRENGPSKLSFNQGEAQIFPQLCLKFFQDKSDTRSLSWKWLFKRILQKIGLRRYSRKIPNFFEDAEIASIASPVMSNLSKKLLTIAISRLGNISRKRIRLQKIWNTLCKETIVKSIDTWTPYLAEYKLETKEEAARIFVEWFKGGRPVSSWPDLPPEVLQNYHIHQEALYFRNTRLYLAVHQSLPENRICKAYSNIRIEKRSDPLFERINDKTWNTLLGEAEHSILLQSWAYGEAKVKCEGWKVTRFLIKIGEKKIGVLQILTKTFFRLFKIHRINRGPLFFKETTSNERQSVLYFLRHRFGSISKGNVLFLNPELDSNGENILLLNQLGFQSMDSFPWSSSYIDLSLDVNVLRQKLDSKWRNMLSSAEKTGLTLEIGSDDEKFDWMVDRYFELMSTKNFSGIPISLLKKMRETLPECEMPLVLIAKYDSNRVACICLSLSNRTAMYLIGWNGEIGRKLKANQFLLWNAMIELKNRGFSWLDLGGIDEENTPGIAEFKLGINGQRYELAGEFIGY